MDKWDTVSKQNDSIYCSKDAKSFVTLGEPSNRLKSELPLAKKMKSSWKDSKSVASFEVPQLGTLVPQSREQVQQAKP